MSTFSIHNLILVSLSLVVSVILAASSSAGTEFTLIPLFSF